MITEKMKCCIEWIKNQVENAKCKKCVIGLSGGIDSALVTALCIEAIGAENVITVFMPCDGTYGIYDDLKMVDLMKNKFNLKQHINIDLNYSYITVFSEFKKHPSSEETMKLTSANIKARLRMMHLYAYANLYNGLVIGTGNKTEEILGYFTKYGDGGVDILPIGDLHKSEVKQWAKSIGIPKEIINRAPSAGLWEGQTDEKELGFSYDKIEKMLQNDTIVSEINQRIENTEHKRNMPPIWNKNEDIEL